MKNRIFRFSETIIVANSIPGRHSTPQPGQFAPGRAVSFATLICLMVLTPPATHAAAPRYLLINLGSLEGTNYYETYSGLNGQYLNNSETVVGGMDTSVPDPACFNSSCLTSHNKVSVKCQSSVSQVSVKCQSRVSVKHNIIN